MFKQCYRDEVGMFMQSDVRKDMVCVDKIEKTFEVMRVPHDFRILNEREEDAIAESSGFQASMSVLENWDDTIVEATKVRTETAITSLCRAILFQALSDIGLCEGGTKYSDWADARSWFFAPNDNFDLVMDLFHIDPSWLRGKIAAKYCRCGAKKLAFDYCQCLSQATRSRTFKEEYV